MTRVHLKSATGEHVVDLELPPPEELLPAGVVPHVLHWNCRFFARDEGQGDVLGSVRYHEVTFFAVPPGMEAPS
jgi:hypothetical protein